ncbi:hypothetical protein LINPERPRIM_LOCUS20434 [Linum perenne]
MIVKCCFSLDDFGFLTTLTKKKRNLTHRLGNWKVYSLHWMFMTRMKQTTTTERFGHLRQEISDMLLLGGAAAATGGGAAAARGGAAAAGSLRELLLGA